MRGRDLKKYTYGFSSLYMIISKYKDHEALIEGYPIIYNYLCKHEDRLKLRGQVKNGQHHWLELDNNPTDAYFSLFEKPKIVWGEISDKPKFAYDESGYYAEATTFFMVGEKLKYLLTILNSKLSEWYFSQISTTTGMGTNRWKKYKIQQMPIKEATIETENKLTQLVDSIISNKQENLKTDTTDLEQEIDLLVYKLYNLTYEEVKIIDNDFAMSKAAYEGFEVGV